MNSFILIKNDCIERGLVGVVLARLEACGLRVESLWTVTPSKLLLSQHYAQLAKKNPAAFERTVESMKDKPVFAATIVGPNAVQKVRQIVGATFPLNAAPGTIRGDLGNDTVEEADRQHRTVLNLIHASDSEENAAQELAIWRGAQVERQG